jgi:hypothetical protein
LPPLKICNPSPENGLSFRTAEAQVWPGVGQLQLGEPGKKLALKARSQ